MESAREAVENNSTGKTPQQHREEGDLTLGDIISANRKYILIGTSFIPVVGDIQGFVEAKTVGDYVFATIGVIPAVGDAAQKIRGAKIAYDAAKAKGDVGGMKSAIGGAVEILQTSNQAEIVSGRVVASRINIAQGSTRYTPLRTSGNSSLAGFKHVVEGHFNRPLANNRSIFSITPEELKVILSDRRVVASPVRQIGGGYFERVVNVNRTIGRASLNHGGVETSYIRILTDVKGNLITAYPVKGGI